MISISTYNDIQRQFIRQEKLSNKPKIVHTLESGQKYFRLTRRGKAKRNALIRLVQWLINQRIKYETTFAHQETIAHGDIERGIEGIGCDVRHLRKLIRQLKADGWLTVIDTPTLCNIYILHPIFDDRAFCVGMNYVFNNLLVDKDIYRTMYASKHMHDQLAKRDIKEYQYQETVFEDERFVPQETNQEELDKIFGYRKPDYAKMPSLYKEEYTYNKFTWENEWSGTEFYVGIDMDRIKKDGFGEGELEAKQFKPIFLIPDQSSLEVPEEKEIAKKGIVMKTYELKSIKPTLYGQIRLNAFPEEAIRTIDSRVYHMKERPEKPWQYFVSACKKHCEKYDLPIDWSAMQKLAAKHQMPDLGPFIDESFIPSPNPVPVKKTYGNQQGTYDAVGAQSRAIEAAKLQAQENSRIKRQWQTEPIVSDKKADVTIMSINPIVEQLSFKPMPILQSIAKLAQSVDKPIDYNDSYGDTDEVHFELYGEDPFGDRI